MAWMGIDAGTTACKATVFNENGEILAFAREEFPVVYPQPGWAECNPEKLWETVVSCIRQCTLQTEEPILALAVSSCGEGVIPLDEAGHCVGNEILSFDTRTMEQVKKLREKFGDRYFFERGGQLLASMGTVTKIMWCLEHGKTFRQEPKRFACVGDYLTMRLCGRRVIDFSLAARTMMLDAVSKKWNGELLDYLGLEEKNLSVLAAAGSCAGKIQEKTAREVGLKPETLVCIGGHDQPCALLGAGCVKAEEAVYSMGTTETLVCRTEYFMRNLYDLGLPCYPSVENDCFVTLPGNFTGGNLLQWYRDQFGGTSCSRAKREGKDVYEILMEKMDSVPSRLLVLPHFTVTGSPWNDSESGGMITGLRLDTKEGEYIRGLMEGVTYEILLNLENLKKAGATVETLRAVGGPTKSSKLMQLKADILGLPVSIPEITETPSRGAALLAAKGWGRDLQKSWREHEKIQQTFFPDIKRHEYYMENFERYKRLYPCYKEIYKT